MEFIPLPPATVTGESSALLAVFAEGRLLLRQMEDGNWHLPPAEALLNRATRVIRVGRFGERLCGALELPGCPGVAELEARDIREALQLLPEPERIAAARGRELLFWRNRRRYCGVCGAETVDHGTECARVCTNCGAMFFPVLAPAVIVAVRRGDRLLLAHNRKFREGMYSLIAGFVEAGENLENAVRREIREEVGIEVKNLSYFGSQSWPFPNSLMLGFRAEYADGELRPDGEEISDAGWFRPETFPSLPSPGSISRELIEDYCQRTFPESTRWKQVMEGPQKDE